MRFALPVFLLGLWLIPETFCFRIGRQHHDEVPPMGFNTWNAYGCNLDLLNESNIRRMAHLLNVTGLVEAGYNIFVIDDCWAVKDRRHPFTGELIPDPFRFSSGMHALGNYLNSEGMKFGLYADAGYKTCEGYPGTLGYERIDAQTFARWNVEYLKVDGCNLPFDQMKSAYTTLSRALASTGRRIHYSCSWPAYMLGRYQSGKGNYFDWQYINSICDSWRPYNDIAPYWQNIMDIMDFWGSMQKQFAPITALGGISDPDFIQVGTPTLTIPESMSQMAVWSIVAAPLILSSDLLQGQDPHHKILPQLRNDTLSILMNPEIIQLNQQLPRRQGLRVAHNQFYDIWSRYMNDDSVSMVIVNRLPTQLDRKIKKKTLLKLLCKSMSEHATCPWFVPGIQIEMRDLWSRNPIGPLRNSLPVAIAAHGCVAVNFKASRPFNINNNNVFGGGYGVF